MINKRFKALLMASIFSIMSVFPVRDSYAVVPFAVGLAVRVLATGGVAGSVDLITAAGSALIGGTILALGLYPTDISDSTPVIPLRIPTIDNKNAVDTVIPSSATDSPLTADYEGTAPLEGSTDGVKFSGWTVTGDKFFPTMAAAATAGRYLVFPSFQTLELDSFWNLDDYFPYQCQIDGSKLEAFCRTLKKDFNDLKHVYGPYVYLEYSGPVRCPVGYSANESSVSGCALTDPKAVSKDFLADFRRNGQEYLFTDADSLPSYASVKDGAVNVYGTDSSGKPTNVIVTPNSSGGSDIGVYSQNGSSVTGKKIAVSPAGVVTSVSETSVPGTISAPVSANVPAVNTAVTSTTSTGTETGTSTGTGTGSDIVFPSDYARAGEAQAAANTVKTSIDGVKDKFTESMTLVDPTVPQYVDNWAGKFDNLKGWTLPSHSSNCPTGSFHWEGETFYFDSHCSLIQTHWTTLQSAMIVVWTVLALWVVLGA